MGDGTGGFEGKIGEYDTFAECIAAVKYQQPTANGVTFHVTNGTCYAEFRQNSTRKSQDWQNCVIEPTATLDAGK